ncbi:MAG: DUF1254 domain-containing protein [Phycisphaerales bacterium]|nr:DUF1254 domain-containing protein [Phycisphaerales bacterium]
MIRTPHTLASVIACMFLAPCAMAGDGDTCTCVGDVNCDGEVDGSDLALLLDAWGPASAAMPNADVNEDGTVNAFDLNCLFSGWGDCLGPPSSVTDPATIKALAKDAYIWSLPLEFTYRFGNYNTLITGDVNTLVYVPQPAAWNNAATNGGDSSVLYINGILDLTGADTAFVFTQPNPPSYVVSQFVDAFINTFANPGSRTTPSATNPTSYLLVGPDSPYSTSSSVVIQGVTFPVIASPTNRAQLLTRILASTLQPSTDPDSTYSMLVGVAQQFRLNTLEEFLAKGAVPPAGGFASKVPTAAERNEAVQWQNCPSDACAYFEQVGDSLQLNDLPVSSTGLGGTSIATLPDWVVPQPLALKNYYTASAFQQGALALFAPLGLSQSGFQIPSNWGPTQIQALQDGFADGVSYVLTSGAEEPVAATNWWYYKNSKWGAYPNTIPGYATRAYAVIAGGLPSLVEDGFYAGQAAEPNSSEPLLGDNVYTMTFQAWDGVTLPADGILPPLMLYPNGADVGFWSVTLYQPGGGEAVCPCISQASVLNTHYSQATTPVLSVNVRDQTITATVPYGATLLASAPVLFGDTAAEYGLQPNVAYFLVNIPTNNADGTVTFQVSATWQQALSSNPIGDPGTPVQFSGAAGPVVALTQGTSPLTYGAVKAVSQLGSSELNDGSLLPNLDSKTGLSDGTYTIWFAPTLPEGAFIENWIPTPSQAALKALYPDATVLNSDIFPIFRVYAAPLGNDTPSIMPCSVCSPLETVGGEQSGAPNDALLATYRFPLLTKVSPKP